MDAENENEKGGRQPSVVWSYFDILAKEDRIAVCKHCHKKLSYKGGISNLKKHLIRKHDMITKTEDDDDEESMEETYLEDDTLTNPDVDDEHDKPKDRRKSLRSNVWEYFEIVDEELRTAICRICRDEFSYRTTSTNLVKHLKRRHNVDMKHSDDENEEKEERSIVRRSGGPKMSSIAWDYFTIKDPEKRVATCKICENDCSYSTSVSNLTKHVRRRHGNAMFTEEDHEEDGNTSERENRSSIWLYFKRTNRAAGMAMCLICKKQLSYLSSITNLKRHLTRKHPHVQLEGLTDGKKMLIASDGQLYEIEDNPKQEILNHDDDDNDDANETAEPMNEIYLDEIEGNVIEKLHQKPVKKLIRNHQPTNSNKVKRIVINDSDDTTDDEITFKKRYVRKENDSLDRFGKYLVSLMRQLPKAVSNQLQADFVKQIMNCQNNDTVGRVNNGFTTTITECIPLTEETVAVTSASSDDVFVQTTVVDNCQ